MIRVVNPGLFSTVQDEGRRGYLAFGMPWAGVMDRFSYRIANLLCGNPEGLAVIEMTLFGGTYKIEKPCTIAICGADMQAKIDGATLPIWSSVNVEGGTTLEFGYALQGCRTYFAVTGGISVPLLMESRSTYVKAQVGGLKGRALAIDDVLTIGECASRNALARSLPQKYRPIYSENIELRAIIGPQEDAFSDKAIQEFFENDYMVASDADRMGYRLEGAPLEHKDKADIVSDALCRGAVQVPGNGQPIIMMVDCGTTGGYTKIATVIGPDLSLLAQAKPGDHIRFKRVDDSVAVAALSKEMELYGRLPAELSSVELAANQVLAQVRRMSIKIGQETFEVEICEEI